MMSGSHFLKLLSSDGSGARHAPWRSVSQTRHFVPEAPQPPASLVSAAPATSSTSQPSALPVAPEPKLRTSPSLLTEGIAAAAEGIAESGTVNEALANTAVSVGKSVLRRCARRAAATGTPTESFLAHYIEPEHRLDALPEESCFDTSDPSWKTGLHLRCNSDGLSSLEICMADWRRKLLNAHGKPYTMQVRDRIDDVAYHLLYLQQSFVLSTDRVQAAQDAQFARNQCHGSIIDRLQEGLLALSKRVATLEALVAKGPVVHDMSTPKADNAQAVRPQPQTPGLLLRLRPPLRLTRVIFGNPKPIPGSSAAKI